MNELSLPNATPNKSTNVRFQAAAPSWLRFLMRGLERSAPRVALGMLDHFFASPGRHAHPAEEQVWLARAERRTLHTSDMPVPAWDQRPFVCYRWGVGQRRGRVLLVHGWGGRATQFHLFLPALLAAGYEVLAVDAPGHGLSDGRRSSLFQFSRSLQKAVRAIGPVDAAIAHSFGCAGLLHALHEGLRLGACVLIAPPLSVQDYLDQLAGALGVSDRLAGRLRQRWEQRLAAGFAELDVRRWAPTLPQSALIIHDRQDREVPWACGAELARHWPGARLHSTEQLGHRRVLKAKPVIEAALHFLEAKAL